MCCFGALRACVEVRPALRACVEVRSALRACVKVRPALCACVEVQTVDVSQNKAYSKRQWNYLV